MQLPYTIYTSQLGLYEMQILAVWWKGLELHGIVELMNSKAAQKAREILQDSGRLGASTRCWSSLAVDSSGTATAQIDCKLIT